MAAIVLATAIVMAAVIVRAIVIAAAAPIGLARLAQQVVAIRIPLAAGFLKNAAKGERIAASLRSDRQAESPHP